MARYDGWTVKRSIRIIFPTIMPSVLPLLQQARRRLMAQAALRYAAAGWLIGAVALIPLAAWRPGSTGSFAAGLSLLGAAVGAGCAFFRQKRLEAIALRLDGVGETRDRLTTALALERSGAEGPMEQAALTECHAWLKNVNFDPAKWLPWRLPRSLSWIVLPLLAVAGIVFFNGDSLRLPSGPADPAALAAAAKLEEMAKKLTEQPGADDLKKVAEALKQSAEKLRSEAESGSAEAAQKAVLRELSAAEEAMKSARQQEAMSALAEAMEPMKSQPHAAEAMEALRKGSAGEAARRMEELAEALAAAQSGKGPESREARMKQLEEAMQKAKEQLGEASRMGQAAAQAAEAAQRGDTPGAAQAMRQMGQALRESREGGGQQQGQTAGQSGDPSSSDEIRKMLAALQQMKQGGSQQSGEGGEGDAQGMAARQPGQGNSPSGEGEGMQGQGDSPGGRPGSELDFGTKATAMGNTAAPPPPPADLQTQIQGLLGEGQSLHTLLPSRSGDAPARTGYRELYEAAAPAAEDALEREQIPLGARLTIRRYFESIRPQR